LYDQLTEAGFETVTPSTNKIQPRIDAVENWLKLNIAGGALYLIDAEHCPITVKGFEAGYVYRKKRSGDTVAVPDKNYFSHIHDANQYGDMVIGGELEGGINYIQSQVEAVNKNAGVYVYN